MIIKYKFSTGEVTEVEVSEEIGTVILDSRREEHASNERHRYCRSEENGHPRIGFNGAVYPRIRLRQIRTGAERK